MTKAKLLVVDDEADLLAELKPFLERSGFDVALATDGVEALALIPKIQPDLVILDINMPRLDGVGVLQHLRQHGNLTPVILLTQITGSAYHVTGLQQGADDYIDKPYDPLELVARVQAVLRRTQRSTPDLDSFRRLVAGDLTLIRRPPETHLSGRKIAALSDLGFRVLEYLMLHPHDIISRQRLFKEVWGSDWIETRAVDLRIAELRKALGDDADSPRFIQTIIGQGYSFIVDVEGQM